MKSTHVYEDLFHKVNIFSSKQSPSTFTSGNVAAAISLYDGIKHILGENKVTLNEGCDDLVEVEGDIHHFHEMGNWSSALAAQSKCAKKIMTMHTSPALDYDGIFEVNPNKNTINNLKPYDHVVVVNPRESAWLDMFMPDKPHTYLPNGINTDIFKPDAQKRHDTREQLGYTDDDDVVLLVAHLQSRKGILDFLQLAGFMQDKKFLLVGKPLYREHPRNMQLIQDNLNHAPSNFKFIAGVEDISAIYTAADKYVCMSYAEGFPMTLLEAAASGLPCICRENPFYRDIFPFIGDFFKHPAEATFLLNDERLMRIVGASARNIVKTDYECDVVAQKHLDFYVSLLDDKTPVENKTSVSEPCNVVEESTNEV